LHLAFTKKEPKKKFFFIFLQRERETKIGDIVVANEKEFLMRLGNCSSGWVVAEKRLMSIK
jgi:hypothetical protein